MTPDDQFDPALKALLDADRAPALSAGFADRVTVAAQRRSTGLPPLRRPASPRWRTMRRVTLGVGTAVLLSTAAAATGVLEQIGIALPPPVQRFVDNVSETVTGRAPVRAEPPALAVPAPTAIEGPVDSPQELEEAFRRAEEARESRTVQRRERVDRMIDAELARRREQGLPAPTPEQEVEMRQRLDDARARRDALADDRRETVRDDLRQRVEAGEPITRETLREVREEAGMAPGSRLTPARREELRRRLAERLQQAPVAEPAPEPAPTADVPPENIP
jgi:hypothetical protein